jgi:hypothetical protein
MKSIEEIIAVTGGWEQLRRRPLTIEAPGFMPLHLEIVGRGPGGGLLLAVSHTYVQNGDLMRDPEVVAEISPGSSDWLPIRYRQDNLGALHEAVVSEGGVFLFHHGLVADLKRFMAFWDENIREQGFIEAARQATSRGPRPPGAGE